MVAITTCPAQVHLYNIIELLLKLFLAKYQLGLSTSKQIDDTFTAYWGY